MATNYNLFEVTCSRDVSGSSFGRGIQDFIFNIGTPNCINFSKSYFKIDMSIIGTGVGSDNPAIPPTIGGIPRTYDLIAFADNCAGNLYTNCFVRMGGQDASSITSFLPQASALKKRISRSHAWLDSIGKDAQFSIASFPSRVQKTSAVPQADALSSDTQYFLKGCTDALREVATISITALTGAVEGKSTAFVTPTLVNANGICLGDTKILEGDILVIDNGSRYTVDTIASNAILTVTPKPNADVALTSNYYFIRQNYKNTTIGKNSISIIWQPPCGIFDENSFLGSGSYKISLQPASDYIKAVVETRNPLFNNAASLKGWSINVDNVRFYAYQAKANIPDGPQSLSLTEVQISPKPITNTNGQGSYQFSVPPSTMYISVFCQSNVAGSDNAYPPSMFKCESKSFYASGDCSLVNLQLTYASINKPSTKWDSRFSTSIITNGTDRAANVPRHYDPVQVNQMAQRYYDTYLENENTANSDSGVETFDEYLMRGPFYHFIFARDMTDRSTELQLNATFDSTNGIIGGSIFVAAWYQNQVEYTVSQGMIVALSTRQV